MINVAVHLSICKECFSLSQDWWFLQSNGESQSLRDWWSRILFTLHSFIVPLFLPYPQDFRPPAFFTPKARSIVPLRSDPFFQLSTLTFSLWILSNTGGFLPPPITVRPNPQQTFRAHRGLRKTEVIICKFGNNGQIYRFLPASRR